MKYGVAKAFCICVHAMQDKLYGYGVRAMNATKKQEPSYIEVRCTVCGKIHMVKPGEVK